MIEKITDQNLERYDSRLKEWCDRKFFEKGNYGKYQTTEEAGAVAFYPVPNTPLEGKVKFSFKETMPAEGTKGPNNPSTIIGVDTVKVTRAGKNLLGTFVGTNFSSGIVTNNQNSSYTFNGTFSNSNTWFAGLINAGSNDLAHGYVQEPLVSGCTYTFSMRNSLNIAHSNLYFQLWKVLSKSPALWEPVFNLKLNNNNQSYTHTINPDVAYHLRLAMNSPESFNNETFYIQIELGDTATSFEPVGAKEIKTISLGDTYYGGEIDLVTGVMTISRFGIVLDSSIPLLANGAYGYAHNNTNGVISNRRIAFKLNGDDQGFPRIQEYNYNSDDVISISHFKRGSHSNSYDTHPIFIIQELPGHWLVFRDDKGWLFSDSRTSSENYLAFLNWLDAEKEAGTPVILTYKLENPFTVQLTPQQILSLPQLNKYTPRLNTVYTDADSIQISYLKSPIRDEYEKTQAILSLGGNS